MGVLGQRLRQAKNSTAQCAEMGDRMIKEARATRSSSKREIEDGSQGEGSSSFLSCQTISCHFSQGSHFLPMHRPQWLRRPFAAGRVFHSG